MDEDQADRTPDDAKSIDWKIVGPRDAARLSRVKELHSKNQLQTAGDYYRAAMILQQREVAEDYLVTGKVAVWRSTDGEKTWGEPASVPGSGYDRPFISCDVSGRE